MAPVPLSLNSKILLVDDLNLVRNMLRQSLKELGFGNMEDASDGEQAIQKLNKAYNLDKRFDLVFLDWNMPIKTGIEVVEYCRSNEFFKTLPIIMVTAEAEKKNVLKALTVGANDYIVKPVTGEILAAKLKHLNEQLMKKAG